MPKSKSQLSRKKFTETELAYQDLQNLNLLWNTRSYSEILLLAPSYQRSIGKTASFVRIYFWSLWNLKKFSDACDLILIKIKEKSEIDLGLLRQVIRLLTPIRDHETILVFVNFILKKNSQLLRYSLMKAYLLWHCGQQKKSIEFFLKLRPRLSSARKKYYFALANLEFGQIHISTRMFRSLAKTGYAEKANMQLARLYLWQGKYQQALVHARLLPKRDYFRLYRHIVASHVLAQQKKYLAALKVFNRYFQIQDFSVSKIPDLPENLIFRAELHRKLQFLEAAQKDFEDATTRSYSLTGHINLVLILVEQLKQNNNLQTLDSEIRFLIDFSHSLAGLMPKKPDYNNLSAWAEYLEEILVKFKGNRHFILQGPNPKNKKSKSGIFYFVPYARAECRRIQLLLRVRGEKRTIADLEVMKSKYPYSAHPLTHIGEIFLWQGLYSKAEKYFKEALRKTGYTSWANVGFIAALLLQKKNQQALNLSAQYQENFPPAPTLFIYLADYYYFQENKMLFQHFLQLAQKYRSRRISTWMFLNLHYLQERPDKVEEIFSFLKSIASQLFREAEEELLTKLNGRPTTKSILLHAFEMMRGNRSSSLVTYYFQKQMRFQNIQWPRELPNFEI